MAVLDTLFEQWDRTLGLIGLIMAIAGLGNDQWKLYGIWGGLAGVAVLVLVPAWKMWQRHRLMKRLQHADDAAERGRALSSLLEAANVDLRAVFGELAQAELSIAKQTEPAKGAPGAIASLRQTRVPARPAIAYADHLVEFIEHRRTAIRLARHFQPKPFRLYLRGIYPTRNEDCDLEIIRSLTAFGLDATDEQFLLHAANTSGYWSVKEEIAKLLTKDSEVAGRLLREGDPNLRHYVLDHCEKSAALTNTVRGLWADFSEKDKRSALRLLTSVRELQNRDKEDALQVAARAVQSAKSRNDAEPYLELLAGSEASEARELIQWLTELGSDSGAAEDVREATAQALDAWDLQWTKPAAVTAGQSEGSDRKENGYAG